jgi:hypothetical protein
MIQIRRIQQLICGISVIRVLVLSQAVVSSRCVKKVTNLLIYCKPVDSRIDTRYLCAHIITLFCDPSTNAVTDSNPRAVSVRFVLTVHVCAL